MKVISKFYDPLGLLSPIVLQMKVLFQEICVENLERDDPLTERFKGVWRKWLLQLQNNHEIILPRYMHKGTQEEVLLQSTRIWRHLWEGLSCRSVLDATDRSWEPLAAPGIKNQSGTFNEAVNPKIRVIIRSYLSKTSIHCQRSLALTNSHQQHPSVFRQLGCGLLA